MEFIKPPGVHNLYHTIGDEKEGGEEDKYNLNFGGVVKC